MLRISKPIFVVLVTNNGCNLNCRYCYGAYGEEKKSSEYSTRELLKIIDELKKLGTRLITMHGGESLMRKDIGEIINYSKKLGFYVSLNTNGYLVSKRINEIKCLDTICLSLDGTEEHNDQNRGKGCFQKVMKAIDVIQSHNIPCVISATLTKTNRDDMDYLAELGRRKNIRIQYSLLYNNADLLKKCSDMVISKEEINEVLKKIFYLKTKKFPIYYSNNVLTTAIEWAESIPEWFITDENQHLAEGRKLIPCFHGKLKFQIDADGRVITCWAHNNTSAPNIKEYGIKEAIRLCQDEDKCRHCTFLANNEHNALMNLSFRNIINILKIQTTDAFKIKK